MSKYPDAIHKTADFRLHSSYKDRLSPTTVLITLFLYSRLILLELGVCFRSLKRTFEET